MLTKINNMYQNRFISKASAKVQKKSHIRKCMQDFFVYRMIFYYSIILINIARASGVVTRGSTRNSSIIIRD